MVALVEHGQPVVGPTLRGALEPLPAESICPAPYGPGVIAELRRCQPDRISPGMGQQKRAGTKPVLRQGGMDFPGQYRVDDQKPGSRLLWLSGRRCLSDC